MTASLSEAEDFARKLLLQAAWPALAIAALAVSLAMASTGHHVTASSLPAAAVVTVISAFTTLAFSVLLLFDALLFRLIASYASEADGCVAVDDILARMRLKSMPERTRSVAERIAGTRRILLAQRTAFAISFAAAATTVFARAG